MIRFRWGSAGVTSGPSGPQYMLISLRTPILPRYIDAGLHREPDPREQLPVVVGLVVVEVRPGAVQVPVDRVPRPVHEILPEPRLFDHPARRPVALEACHRPPLPCALLHRGDRRVPGVAYGAPDLLHLGRHLRRRKTPSRSGRQRPSWCCPGPPTDPAGSPDPWPAWRPCPPPAHSGGWRRWRRTRRSGSVVSLSPRASMAATTRACSAVSVSPVPPCVTAQASSLARNVGQRLRRVAVVRQFLGAPARREAGHQR